MTTRNITPQRASDLAELLSQEVTLMAAGRMLGLTKGETVSTMRRIRLDLGSQAQ